MAAETQAFIDEVKANGQTTRQAAAGAIGSLVPELGPVAQEVETLARLLAAAEITEGDAATAGKIEEGFQKLNALRRQLGELEAEGRKLVGTWRDLLEWYAGAEGFRAAAQDAGYTV